MVKLCIFFCGAAILQLAQLQFANHLQLGHN